MKRHVLFLHPTWPRPDQSSGDYQLVQLIRLLRSADHAVTVVARDRLADPAQKKRYALELLKMGCDLGELFSHPSANTSWGLDLAKQTLRSIVERGRFHAAIVSFWNIALEFAPFLKQVSPETRVLVHSWDVGYMREGRGAALWGHVPELRKIAFRRTTEMKAYAMADAVLAVTDLDGEIIREGMQAELQARRLPVTVRSVPPVLTIPHVHPITPDPKGYLDRRDFLFVGGFRHSPNVDAVLFLVNEVWPLIHRRIPSAKLYVVGADAPPKIRELESASVHILGYVPDLDPLLDQVRVSIAPLRFGAGMKGKISQAMAAGLPVVTTPIGAEGMPLIEGEHVMIGQTAQGLADAAVRLYGGQELWNRLSKSGQRLVDTLYSDIPVASHFFDALFSPLKVDTLKQTETPAEVKALNKLLDGFMWYLERYTPQLALASFAESFQLSPELYAALLAQADLEAEAGEWEKARLHVEQAARIAPNAFGVLAMQAEISLHQQQPNHALQLAERILSIDPKHPDAQRIKALALLRLNQAKQSVELLISAYNQHANSYPNNYRLQKALVSNLSNSSKVEGVINLLTHAASAAMSFGRNADEQDFRRRLKSIVDQISGPDSIPIYESERSPAITGGFAGKPAVDIIIPIYNNTPIVQKCIDSVLRTAPWAHLILVNDDTPEKTMRRLLSDYKKRPNITVIDMPKNSGFVQACHAGARAASAPFILFLNSDTEAIAPGWLEALIPGGDDVAITGAKLIFPPDIDSPLARKIQHAGVYRNGKGVVDHAFYGQAADYPPANQARDVNAVTGACMLIRRSVWEELGGFDPAFGRGIYEDVDLCWRARQKGYRVRYEPSATLYHREHGSFRQERTLHDENFQKNVRLLHQRWGHLPSDEHLFIPPPTPPSNSTSRAEVQATLEASATLAALLEADDLIAALQQNRSKLNTALLDLILANAQSAAADGDLELAEGLEQLHKVIQSMLQKDGLVYPS